MRITLEEMIKRHKENNANSDYVYTKTILF